MNRKSSIQDVALAMVIIFAGALLFFIGKYAYNEIVTEVTANPEFNSSVTAVTVMDQTNDLTSRWDTVIFVLVVAFSLAIIVTGWLVAGEPVFTFIYFIALVILIAISAAMSYVYNQVSNLAIFSVTVTELPITDFIMSNFPVYITIIGFIGMIVLFAKPR